MEDELTLRWLGSSGGWKCWSWLVRELMAWLSEEGLG